jgi:hypothetical protein
MTKQAAEVLLHDSNSSSLVPAAEQPLQPSASAKAGHWLLLLGKPVQHKLHTVTGRSSMQNILT